MIKGRILCLLIGIFCCACGSGRISGGKKTAPTIIHESPSQPSGNAYLGNLNVPNNANRQLITMLNEWLGTPYRYGGQSKNGVDCSGLIQIIYPEIYQQKLPRTSSQMFEQAIPIPVSALAEGDLVFFKINTQQVGHAGLYLWDGNFLHATTSKGVIISNLSQPYWAKYFFAAGRVRK